VKWLSSLALAALGFATPTAVCAQDDDEIWDEDSSEADEAWDEDDVADEDDAVDEDDEGDEDDDEDRDRAKKKKKKEKEGDRDEGESYGHKRQFFVRAGLLLGYHIVFRYADSPFCADPTEDDDPSERRKLCGFATPLAVDLGAGFAPTDSIEPFFWTRLGLATESDTDTLPLVIVGAGARIYTMSDEAFKFFLEPAFGVELEKGGDNPVWQAGGNEYKPDIIVHLAGGPQYDVSENLGLYAGAGLTVGMVRALHTFMELQFGVQTRFP
jgi:hypothetical protein